MRKISWLMTLGSLLVALSALLHGLIVTQWLLCMYHLKRYYPHLFSLSTRIYRFDPDASAVVTQ
jgi:hypothetical protein